MVLSFTQSFISVVIFALHVSALLGRPHVRDLKVKRTHRPDDGGSKDL
jgi:hypothetical protein